MRHARLPILAAALVLTACTSTTHPAAPQPSTSTTAPNIAALGTATSTPATSTTSTLSHSPASPVPRFAHIVVVVLENHSFSQIIGQSAAPYLNSLAARGALLTFSTAITHPSEPNYLALFSGSTQHVTDDSCPHTFPGPDLGGALIANHDTFTGYSEDLPSTGFTGCSSGQYARKHAPWVNFSDVPASDSQPFTAFPADSSRLPTVAFVIPNLDHDMHDGSVTQGDQWLRQHLDGYATWAAGNDSLLVVTTDEDDETRANHITTMLVGAHVRRGSYSTRVDHYGLLHTILDSRGIAPFGNARGSAALTGVWS